MITKIIFRWGKLLLAFILLRVCLFICLKRARKAIQDETLTNVYTPLFKEITWGVKVTSISIPVIVICFIVELILHYNGIV